jgi:hypothetical protein
MKKSALTEMSAQIPVMVIMKLLTNFLQRTRVLLFIG